MKTILIRFPPIFFLSVLLCIYIINAYTYPVYALPIDILENSSEDNSIETAKQDTEFLQMEEPPNDIHKNASSNTEPIEENQTTNGTNGLVTKKESQLESVNTSGHVHHADCYNGDLHIHQGEPGKSFLHGCYTSRNVIHEHTGNNKTFGGCYQGESYYESFSIFKCTKCQTTKQSPFYCESCGQDAETDGSIYYTPRYKLSCGIEENIYYTIGCGYSEDSYYNGNRVPLNPECDFVVLKLEHTKPEQTIYFSGKVNSSVNATMLDGTIRQFNLSDDFVRYQVGTQLVTFTYSGKIGTAKTKSTISTTATVTTLDYVTSITPKVAIQEIYYGGNLDRSVVIKKASTGSTEYEIASSNPYLTITGFDNKKIGTQSVTINYTALTGSYGVIPSTTITVKVIPSLDKIIPTYATQTVYKGTHPNLSVTAYYHDGSFLHFVASHNHNFDNTKLGEQIVTVSYTSGGTTKTATCKVIVIPNVTALSVVAEKTSLLYDQDIHVTATAHYEDGSTATVSPTMDIPFSKTTLGNQYIEFSYTENKKTVTETIKFTVLDYPTNLNVTLRENQIYQGQTPNLKENTVTFASGKTDKTQTPTLLSFDNTEVGNQSVTYQYELNSIAVTDEKQIEVLPDLYSLSLNQDTFKLYAGQELELEVTANFHASGKRLLQKEDYIIHDYDNCVYDRMGRYYTISYTDRGVTVTEQIFISVLPNVVDIMSISVPDGLESNFIDFAVELLYEDGQTVTLDKVGNGLQIKNYNKDLVGYQYVTFIYTESDTILEKTVKIRIRALIKVSIPASILATIDPNKNSFISPDIKIENESKESIKISSKEIIAKDKNEVTDVAPNQFQNWTQLGVKDSNSIALGLDYESENWKEKSLPSPLYVVDAKDTTLIGVIDKETSATLKMVANYGTSHNTQKEFEYDIRWHIELAEE